MTTARKPNRPTQADRLSTAYGTVRDRAHPQQPERWLWENEDWVVTTKGLRSKWLANWTVPVEKLMRLRDLSAKNLPKDVELHRLPFISALEVALAVHFPAAETIREVQKNLGARHA